MNQFTSSLRRQESSPKMPADTMMWRVISEARTVAAPANSHCDLRHVGSPLESRGERTGRFHDSAHERGAGRCRRTHGALIIHAPSDTMTFMPITRRGDGRKHCHSSTHRRRLIMPTRRYRSMTPTRGRIPVKPALSCAWSRQHAALVMDDERDLITDNGSEVYRALRHYEIEQLLIMGVHTNMCVLRRSFAIKQMVRWGVQSLGG